MLLLSWRVDKVWEMKERRYGREIKMQKSKKMALLRRKKIKQKPKRRRGEKRDYKQQTF